MRFKLKQKAQSSYISGVLTILFDMITIALAVLMALLSAGSTFDQESLSTIMNMTHMRTMALTSPSTNNQNTTYLNMYGTCQSTIDVDPASTAYNETAIKCAEESLKKCEHSNIHILYGLGSLTISIQAKEDGSLCSIKLIHEIEMGQKRYECLVPFNKLAAWISWKKSDGVGAVNDILSSCNIVR